MKPSRIQAVDHIHIEAPLGSDEDVRWFYGELCELEECPGLLADAPTLRFKSSRIVLHVRLVPIPDTDPMDERFVLAVTSLEQVVELLEERKLPYHEVRGFGCTDRRILVMDPGGNRIVLKRHFPEIGL